MRELGEGSPLSMPAGGIEIIQELSSDCKFEIPIIILTQYHFVEIEDEYYSIDDTSKKIKDYFSIKFIDVVLYDNDKDNWKVKICNFLGS